MSEPPPIPGPPHPPIRKPLAWPWVLLGVLLLLGLGLLLKPVSDRRLEDGIVVSIRVEHVGATPEEIERAVSVPLELSLAGVPGIVAIRSAARAEISVVDVEFSPGTGEDVALASIRKSLAGVSLPEDAGSPEVEVRSGPGDRTVLIVLSGDADPTHAALAVRERLLEDPGVRRVELIGDRREVYLIEVDEQALLRFDLSPDALLDALREGLSAGPRGGSLDGGIQVRTIGGFREVEDLEHMVLLSLDEQPVYVRDIARVVRTYDEPISAARDVLGPAVLLQVVCRAGPILRGEIAGLGVAPGVRCRLQEVDEEDDHLLFLNWRTPTQDRLDALPDVARLLAGCESVTDMIAWASPEEESRAVLRTAVPARDAAPAVLLALTRVPGIVLLGDPAPGHEHLTLEVYVEDRRDAAEVVEDLRNLLRSLPGVEYVVTDLAPASPEVRLVVDRERAAAMGTTREQVEAEIALRMTGREVGEIEGVPVVARIGERSRELDGLEGIRIWTPTGVVMLEALTTVELANSPSTVRRVSGRRAVTLGLTLSKGADREDVRAKANDAVRSTEGVGLLD